MTCDPSQSSQRVEGLGPRWAIRHGILAWTLSGSYPASRAGRDFPHPRAGPAVSSAMVAVFVGCHARMALAQLEARLILWKVA